MYEDFYAFIPGSLEARQRLRKLRIKRLLYTLGAIVIFGSGFILGLEWEDPNIAPGTLASTGEHQFEAGFEPPVSTTLPEVQPVLPEAQLALPDVEPLPTPPSEPAQQAAFDSDIEQAITEADASKLSALILDATATPFTHESPAPTEAAMQDHEEQDPSVKPAEVASQPESAKPVATKPKPAKVRSPKPKPVATQANTSTASEATQPKSSRRYLVQVGAFSKETNARGVVSKLREKGYAPFMRAVPGSNHRVLYRVFIERVNDRAQAQAAAKAFEAAEKMDALVMLADNLPDKAIVSQ